MLSLSGERLTPKGLDHYLHNDMIMLQILLCFWSFTHLRRPRWPPKFNQFFIVLPRTPPTPLPHAHTHKISSQSMHNFVSSVVHKQTDIQTHRQTARQSNQRHKNVTFFCQWGNNGPNKGDPMIFPNTLYQGKLNTHQYTSGQLQP